MKKTGWLWLGAAVLIIVIFVVLQSQYKICDVMEQPGYAVTADSLDTLLKAAPDAEITDDKVELCAFEDGDNLYTRYGNYYLGEDQRTQIDYTYPLYIKSGAGILLNSEEGTLYNQDFQTVGTYDGLIISDANSYNTDGARADADTFYFYRTPDGIYYNCMTISVPIGSKTRTIAPLSIISFYEDHINFLEYTDGQLRYGSLAEVALDTVFTINGENYTYQELLKKLDISFSDSSSSKAKEEVTETEELETETETELVADTKTKKKKDSTNNTKKKDSDDDKKTNSEDSEEPTRPDRSEQSTQESSSSSENEEGGGVRSDEDRPDKAQKDKSDSDKTPEVNYQEPSVTLNDYYAKIYSLNFNLTISDPANRLDPTTLVTIEIYNSDNERVYRTYGSGGDNVTYTVASGYIKPGTTYRAEIKYAYYDEYNALQSVTLQDNLSLTTGDLSGAISFQTGALSDSENYNSIPVTFDNYVKIKNLAYDSSTNTDLLEGLASGGKFAKIYFYESETARDLDLTRIASKAASAIDSNFIKNLKAQTLTDLTSNNVLEADTTYYYVIELKDYFGTKFTLQNNTGSFTTCKPRMSGTVNVTDSTIDGIVGTVSISDENATALANSEGSYDIYLVATTLQYKKTNYSSESDFWTEVESFLSAGSGDNISYVKQFDASSYKVENGQLIMDKAEFDTGACLKLGQKYYLYLIADYNLNNYPADQYSNGDVRHSIIGSAVKTTENINSLGALYFNSSVDNVSYSSADFTLSFLKDRTDETLYKLVTNIKVHMESTDGAQEESFDISLTSSELENLLGYKRSNGTTLKCKDILISIGDRLSDQGKALSTMTKYKISLNITGVYAGNEYELTCSMGSTTFKTLRYPTEVTYKDLLLAGGKLIFDLNVYDPDDCICGTEGDTVTLYVYNENTDKREKVITVEKNKSKDEYTKDILFTGLQENTNYTVYVYAEEYTEAFGSPQYSYLLATIEAHNPVDLKGTEKLHSLEKTGNNVFTANVSTEITDSSNAMDGNPYTLKIYRTRQDQTEETLVTTILNDKYVFGMDGATGLYTNKEGNDSFTVTNDDGFSYTYRVSLSATVQNRTIELDSLTFTSEQEIVELDSTYDFVKTLKDNNGYGKYVVTADIDLGTLYDYKVDEETGDYVLDSDGKKVVTTTVSKIKDSTGTYEEEYSPFNIVEVLYAQIDFQGYKLAYNYNTNKNAGYSSYYYNRGAIFNNIAPSGEIANADIHFTFDSNISLSTIGFLSNYNYGSIHDVYVTYHGGQQVSRENYYMGLITRANCATGSISNFVVNNAPDDGMVAFACVYDSGMVCQDNYGTIKNGYVYGEDIDASATKREYKYIGGMIGNQGSSAKTMNLYSLIGIKVSNPGASQTQTLEKRYGTIIGSAAGITKNMYGTKINYYNAAYNGATYDSTAIGPVLGTNTGTRYCKNVYYWNENKISFSKASYQSLVTLNTLKDKSWQTKILGSEFDSSIVELGYFPHVNLTNCMPEQEYIEIEEASESNEVELVSCSLEDYSEDGSIAYVDFRFLNPNKLTVTSISSETAGGKALLNINLLSDTSKWEDGYTTISGEVSVNTLAGGKHGGYYRSSYKLTGFNYKLGSQIKSYDQTQTLLVDFYRNISTPDDWYNYVMQYRDENYNLTANIDFSNVAYSKIRITSDFTGNIRGGTDENGKGYALKNISISGTDAYVFAGFYGAIENLQIVNMKMDSNKKNVSFEGFIRDLYGTVQNVHISGNTKLTGCRYMGALVCRAQLGSSIQDCTVGSVTIDYQEPNNVNTDAYVGGLVGYSYYSQINNCFVRDLNISVLSVQNSYGVGGLVGYNYYTLIDSCYAQGQINTKCINTGGLLGYSESNKNMTQISNVFTDVDITTNQENAGGIVGQLYLTEALITEQFNITGVAYGDVICSSPTYETVSYTVGRYKSDYKGKFYGCECQTVQRLGKIQTEADDNTIGLLLDDTKGDSLSMREESTYTRSPGVSMDSVYNYKYVETGYPDWGDGCLLPTLYYKGTSKALPNQTDKIYLLDYESPNGASLISVNSIGVQPAADQNTKGGYIYMELSGPAGYTITDMVFEDLNTYEFGKDYNLQNILKNGASYQFDENGDCYVKVYYKIAESQQHFYDSYILSSITVEKRDENGKLQAKSVVDMLSQSISAALQMYGTISTVDDWNYYMSASRNYGNYENYVIMRDLKFPSNNTVSGKQVISYAINAKIGRLVGTRENYESNTGDQKSAITISNVNITEKSNENDNANFIFRIATELSNIIFKDCTVINTGRDVEGLIGTSSATIGDVTFDNIVVKDKSANDRRNLGVIGYQTGGQIGIDASESKYYTKGKVTVKNVTVGWAPSEITDHRYNKYYVGGLVGRTISSATFKNIYAENVTVYGKQCVGGLVGYSDFATYTDIELNNIKVYATARNFTKNTTYPDGTVITAYAGGMIGYANANTQRGASAPKIMRCSITGEKFMDIFGTETSYSEINTASRKLFNNDDSQVFANLNELDSAYVATDALTTVRGEGEDVGGLVGYANYWHFGNNNGSSTSESSFRNDPEPNTASNVIVVGTRTNIGGICGYARYASNDAIEDSYVEKTNYNIQQVTSSVGHTDNTLYYRIGGIDGYNNGWTSYSQTAKNVVVKAIDSHYVGGALGLGGSPYYYTVEDCKIVATNTTASNMGYFGGVFGQAYNTFYDVAINTTIDATTNNAGMGDCRYAGGITGYAGYNGNRNYGGLGYCAAYATQTANNSPEASSKYYIRTNQYAGGLSGRCGNREYNSFSNLNIIADYYAGGLVGLYENGYDITASYGYAGLRYCYAAGTVTAKGDYAGGLIGCNELYKMCKGVGRSTVAYSTTTADYSTAKTFDRSNGSNEYDFTYCNMMLCSKITASNENISGAIDPTKYTYSNTTISAPYTTDGSHAFAFCGNVDGFEGRANYWAQTSYFLDKDGHLLDNAEKYTARNTVFYEGCQLTTSKNTASPVTKYLYTMTSSDDRTSDNYVPDYARNGYYKTSVNDAYDATKYINWSSYTNVTYRVYDSAGNLSAATIDDIGYTDVRGNTSNFRYVLYNGGYTDYEYTTEKYGKVHCGSYFSDRCELDDNYNSFNVRLVSGEQLKDYNIYYNIYWYHNSYGPTYVGNNERYTKSSNQYTIYTTEVDGSVKYVRNWDKAAYYLYNTRGSWTWSYNESSSYRRQYNQSMFGYYTVILINGARCGSADQTAPYNCSGNKYTGATYLPHFKNAWMAPYSTYSLSDDYTTLLAQNGIFINVPSYYERPADVGKDLDKTAVDSKVVVNATGVNQVTIEFGDELLSSKNGETKYYYSVEENGSQTVEPTEITAAEVSCPYSFSQDMVIKYSTSSDMSNALTNDTTKTTAANLRKRIATYNGSAYYISSDGTTIYKAYATNTAATSSSRTSWMTASDGVTFIHIYRGQALDSEKKIYDLATGEVVGMLGEDGAVMLASSEDVAVPATTSEATPLQEYTLNGYTVKTYAMRTYVIGSEEVVRDDQMVLGADDTMEIIDGDLEIEKDSTNVYTLDGKTYCTVLDEDGNLVDLCQGTDAINTPKGMKLSGIADMTSNYDAGAPITVLEYTTGAVVGYNYETGEYLFKDSSGTSTSLGDYFKSFVRNTTSNYGDVYKTYDYNEEITDKVVSSERLEEMLTDYFGDGVTADYADYYGVDRADISDYDYSKTGDDSEHNDSGAAKTEGEKNSGNSKKADGDTAPADDLGNSKSGSEKNYNTEDSDADHGSNKGSKGGDTEAESQVADNYTDSQDDENAADPMENPNGSKEEIGELEDSKSTGDTETGSSAEDTESTESSDDATKVASADKKLVTKYDSDAEEYVIVDMDKYLTDESYKSENDRLGVDDMSVLSDDAAQAKETEENHAIWIYILVAVGIIVLLGAGIIIFVKVVPERQQKKKED